MTGKLSQIADEYFAKINPIATRIKLDIIEIANAYEHLWTEFNQTERCEVIDETLIKPEIVLKYFDQFLTASKQGKPGVDPRRNYNQDYDEDDDDVAGLDGVDSNGLTATDGGRTKNWHQYDGKHISSYARCKTGLKRNQDQDLCGIYWNDEHSPPFSVKTMSQINFNAFDVDTPVQLTSTTTVAVGANTDAELKSVPNVKGIKQKCDIRPASSALVDKVAPSSKYFQQKPTQSSLQQHQQLLPQITYNNNPIDKESLPLLKFNTGAVGAGPTSANSVCGTIGVGTTAATNVTTTTAPATAATDGPPTTKSNFLSKLMQFNSGGSPTTTNIALLGKKSNVMADITAADGDEEGLLLISNISFGMQSSSSGPSEEEDEKINFGEFSSLLENNELNKKGYDFLNNW